MARRPHGTAPGRIHLDLARADHHGAAHLATAGVAHPHRFTLPALLETTAGAHDLQAPGERPSWHCSPRRTSQGATDVAGARRPAGDQRPRRLQADQVFGPSQGRRRQRRGQRHGQSDVPGPMRLAAARSAAPERAPRSAGEPGRSVEDRAVSPESQPGGQDRARSVRAAGRSAGRRAPPACGVVARFGNRRRGRCLPRRSTRARHRARRGRHVTMSATASRRRAAAPGRSVSSPQPWHQAEQARGSSRTRAKRHQSSAAG